VSIDLIVHIEIKMEGKWRHYTRAFPERNYGLYGLISKEYFNSKSDGLDSTKIRPLFPTRGIPENATYLTIKEHHKHGSDSHYPSWLDAEDLIKLRENYLKLVNPNASKFRILTELFQSYIFSGYLISWYEYPEDNFMDIEDLRIVFWFS